MIFNYYAARRQADEMESLVMQTFEDMAAYNQTIDQPELQKFMEDFFPSAFSHRVCSMCLYVSVCLCSKTPWISLSCKNTQRRAFWMRTLTGMCDVCLRARASEADEATWAAWLWARSVPRLFSFSVCHTYVSLRLRGDLNHGMAQRMQLIFAIDAHQEWADSNNPGRSRVAAQLRVSWESTDSKSPGGGSRVASQAEKAHRYDLIQTVYVH